MGSTTAQPWPAFSLSEPASLEPATLHLVARLASAAARPEAAGALAARLGAELLIIFVPDAETGRLLPAPGFPQTIPELRAWRPFLAECVRGGLHTGYLRRAGGLVQSAGVATDDGSVVLLLGGRPPLPALVQLRPVLSILTGALRAEQHAWAAAGQAAAAQQAVAETRALAESLDAAREEAEAAQARYRAVFEGVADAILATDGEGRPLEANPRASELLGYAHEELLSLRVSDLAGASWTAAAWQQLREQGDWGGELELRRKDGTIVPVEARASAIRLPGGAVYLFALRDISERRAVERLQRDFLAMVTHELRSPLASLKGFAQLLRRRRTYDEHAVEVILTQATRLERLIGDLLDVSRIEAGQLELRRAPVNLVEVVHAAAARAQALTRMHAVRVEAPERPLVGRWDRGRLEQVLDNLLSNAIKYSPDGGKIVIAVEDRGGDVRVSVSDQGMGLAPDQLGRLFQRFFRTAQARASGAQGLGLGLYISKSLVEAHGGRIWAVSEPGRGSTFTFALPYTSSGPEQAVLSAGEAQQRSRADATEQEA